MDGQKASLNGIEAESILINLGCSKEKNYNNKKKRKKGKWVLFFALLRLINLNAMMFYKTRH